MLGQRRPRQGDPAYLRWLRRQPCACGCLQGPPCDAAHLRSASLAYHKPLTGMGRRPDDFWVLPLKHAHHMDQHAFGNEVLWWALHGIHDPWRLCVQHYARYVENGGKPPRNTVKRKPGRAIQSRGFAKVHRPMRKAP